MHYSVCHSVLMELLQIVHVPKQFALTQAKKRDQAMRLCSIKGSERKEGTFSLSGLMNEGDASLIFSVHRSLNSFQITQPYCRLFGKTPQREQ